MPVPIIAAAAVAGRAGAGLAARGAAGETITGGAVAKQFGQAGLRQAAIGRHQTHEPPAQEQKSTGGSVDYLAEASNAYSAILQGGQFG